MLFLNENIGGHATVHKNLAAALALRQDLDATFIHLPPRGPIRKVLGASLPILGRRDLDLQPLRSQLAASAVARRLLRGQGCSRSGLGFDALHVYTQNSALLSSAILRAGPTVLSGDSTNALNAFRLPYRPPTRFTPHTLKVSRVFDRRTYNAATLVVGNSHWMAESLRSYGIPADRIRVLPFGVPVLPVVERPPIGERARITFVGYQLERKGGLLLLEVHQRHLREKCELVLVTTEAIDLRPGVTVLSDVRPGDGQLATILEHTSIFVFPSRIDQSPNVVLEAMAQGVPVVAARTGAVPEMIEDGVSGLLIDPGDGAALLAAVQSLLKDPTRAEAMGAAGREVVLDRFDMMRNAEDLVGILGETIDLYERHGPIHP